MSNKVIGLMESLTQAEFARLRKFIHSPYFCEHNETIQFFDFLSPYYPHFQFPIYQTYSEKHHGGKLTKVDFNLLKSYLQKLIYEFLAQESLRKSAAERDEHLVSALFQKERYNDARKRLEAIKSDFDRNLVLDSSNWLRKVQWSKLDVEHGFSTNVMEGLGESIQTLFDALDQLYIGLSYKYLLPALSFSQLLPTTFPAYRLTICEQMVSQSGKEIPVLTGLYKKLVQMLQPEEADNQHAKLLAEIYQTMDSPLYFFSPTERINIYGFIQNHLTNQYLRGEKGSLEALFALYQRHVNEDLVLGRGDFTDYLVRNMTTGGCRLGETKWIRTFFEENHSKLSIPERANNYGYCKALLEFTEGNYPKAISHLQEVHFKDFTYRVNHQLLLLRTYYELGETEPLLSLLHTFRRFLNRSNALSIGQKAQRKAFLSILFQLVFARERQDPKRTARIRRMLASPQKITDRTWLEKKFAELGN